MTENQQSTEACTDRRLANLRPAWPKGTSGNPRGREPGSVNITTHLRRILTEFIDSTEDRRTRAEAFARAMLDLAENGNAAAIREIFARVDGVLGEKMETNTGSVKIVVEYLDDDRMALPEPEEDDEIT